MSNSSITTTSSFTDGLRELAALLDEHDAVRGYDDYRHLICVRSREEMTTLVRTLGGRWEKDKQSTDYFGMTRWINEKVRLYVYTARVNVCERIVVGTETVEVPDPELVAGIPRKTVEREVVEWRCPPSLLAEVQS